MFRYFFLVPVHVLFFGTKFSTLCGVSETLTKWKSESMTNLRTDGGTDVGAKDACTKKKQNQVKCENPR